MAERPEGGFARQTPSLAKKTPDPFFVLSLYRPSPGGAVPHYAAERRAMWAAARNVAAAKHAVTASAGASAGNALTAAAFCE